MNDSDLMHRSLIERLKMWNKRGQKRILIKRIKNELNLAHFAFLYSTVSDDNLWTFFFHLSFSKVSIIANTQIDSFSFVGLHQFSVFLYYTLASGRCLEKKISHKGLIKKEFKAFFVPWRESALTVENKTKKLL